MKINFREEQEYIMKYSNGKLGIPAVPGAGKTFILSHLVGKLYLENLKEDEEILVITYMNSSVANFKEKIREVLKDNESREVYSRVKVMTIHSLASEILKENIDILSLEEGYQNISSANMYYLMSLAVAQLRRESPEKFQFFIREDQRTERNYKKWNDELTKVVLRLMSKCKNEDISLRELVSRTKGYKRDSLLKLGANIYERYQKSCKKESYIDYDDLLFLAYKVLQKDPNIAKKYRKKYKYILEDEAQDSNKIQNRILKLISNGNLVRVGDLNQSILATFTNSSPKLFKGYLKANPQIKMFTAGRSSKEIIGLANFFVKENRKNHPVKEGKLALEEQLIEAVPEGSFPINPKIQVFGLKTILEEDEERELMKMVAFVEAFSKKYPEKKIGVLFPKNFQIEKTARIMKKKRMDFQILASVSEKLIDTLELLGDTLLFISRPHNNRYFVDLVIGRLDLDIEKESRFLAYIRGVSMEMVLYDIDNLNTPNDILESKVWREFFKVLKETKYILEFPQNSLERLILFIGDIYKLDSEQQLLIEKISGDLKKVFKLNPRWSLYDLARELKKTRASDFTFLAKSVEEELEEIKESNHQITLTTYHRSKGMEWDMVWLFNLNTRSFPAYLSDSNYGEQHYLKDGYELPQDYVDKEFRTEFISKDYENITLRKKAERVAESIRLIYVGITRAKEYLIVSCNKEDDNYYFKNIEKYIDYKRSKYEGYKKR